MNIDIRENVRIRKISKEDRESLLKITFDTAFIIDPENHIIKGEFIKIGGIKPLEINFINQNSKYPILFKFVGYKRNLVLFIKDKNEISQKRTSLYLNRINSQISKSKIVVDFKDKDYNNFNAVYLNVESYFLLPLFPIQRSNWVFFRIKGS